MKYTVVISSASQSDITDALNYYLNVNAALAEKLVDLIEEA